MNDLSDNDIQNNNAQQLVPETQLIFDLASHNQSIEQLIPEPVQQIPVIEQLFPQPNPLNPNFIDFVSNTADFEIIEENNPLLFDNNEYQLLYDNNVNNPFHQSLINKLNYDTDDEQNEFIRILYSWKYEINYDYFDFKNINIFISKNNKFKNKLNELKQFRNYSNINSCISGYEKTGNIIKLKNIININKNSFVYTYFIVYYDNTKVDIIFYGIFNQKIDEEKIISNVIFENKFGKKGIVTNNNLFNLNNYDFIVFYKKVVVE